MTAVRQDEGDSALGNLESFRRDAPGMKGDDGDSREQAKNLDIDKHRSLISVAAEAATSLAVSKA